MGQQQPGFVVEIASQRLGRFQALPQSDPDEPVPANREDWRITVNPSAELFGTPRLRQLIHRLYQQQKLLTWHDGRQIFSALQAIDPSADLLLPLLTVVSNATAYPANQVLMREMRICDRVVEMATARQAWSRPCRVMILQCLANMAVCSNNHQILRKAIPFIISRLSSTDEMEVTIALQALTNLSVSLTTSEVELFAPAVAPTLQHVWKHGEPNLHSLRLLVNLSCCPDMVPTILGAKAVNGLLNILDTDRADVLARAVTWLLCMSSAVQCLNIRYDQIAQHNQDPFGSASQTLFFCIYGPASREDLCLRLKALSSDPTAPEIKQKAARLLETLSQIPPSGPTSCHLNRL